ncbi:hypothetical protein HPB48_004477 [Haemaphysalis longicornis]|uniref:Uncharacterized protein n=1 Tax=Haemaphysalis longicornis TaxID=44386 RepID=A0A9J6GIT1_HAELO|nr:hypothetical protein HPB48_004477 [Haemaphysalis longicornis]
MELHEHNATVIAAVPYGAGNKSMRAQLGISESRKMPRTKCRSRASLRSTFISCATHPTW